MYDHTTGTFFNSNVPFEERGTYLRETGTSKGRVLTQWEKDLVQSDIIKAHFEHFRKIHNQ